MKYSNPSPFKNRWQKKCNPF